MILALRGKSLSMHILENIRIKKKKLDERMHWSAHYLNQSSERTVRDAQSILVLIARQAVTMGPRKAAGQCLHVHGLHYISPSEVPLPQPSISQESKDEDEQVKKLSCILQQKWDLFISSYMAVGTRPEQKQTAPLKQVHTAQVVFRKWIIMHRLFPWKTSESW